MLKADTESNCASSKRLIRRQTLTPMDFGCPLNDIPFIDNYPAGTGTTREIGGVDTIVQCNGGTDLGHRVSPAHKRPGHKLSGRFTRAVGRSLSRHTQEARLTRISLSIICLYLSCHFWKLIPTFYEVVYGSDSEWPSWLSVIKDLSHVLIVFNSAVNFMLYLIM